MAQKQKTRLSYVEDRHLIQLAASSKSLEAIADEMPLPQEGSSNG